VKIPAHILTDLQKRKSENSFRILSHPKGIDFSSNDFFGLAQNSELLFNIKDNIGKLNQSGSKGSRLLSGNTPYHEKLEEQLQDVFKSESTLLFNSGYSANLALLSSIPTKNDTIIYDEKAHASIKDGARLSFAKKYTFKHNDSIDLDKKLTLAQGEKYVVVEAIYSMDGDFCDIKKILAVCKKHKAYLIVDEAHSTAIYGENASGWVAEKGLEKEIFARIFTFGKAVGSGGACITTTLPVKEYLINFARPFIYTTAMSLFQVITIQESINFIVENPQLKQQLLSNISFFKQDFLSESNTAIQPVFFPGNDHVKKITQQLTANNFDVKPIVSPTVTSGTERIRICLHSFNSKEDITALKQFLVGK